MKDTKNMRDLKTMEVEVTQIVAVDNNDMGIELLDRMIKQFEGRGYKCKVLDAKPGEKLKLEATQVTTAEF